MTQTKLNIAERAEAVYELAVKMHGIVEVMSERTVAPVAENTVATPELVDYGYFLRETEDLLDECRKQLAARKQLVERLLCARAMQRALDTGDPLQAVAILRGEKATASPRGGVGLIPPKRGTPAHTAALVAMGMPKELAESGTVDFHFPTLQAWVQGQVEAGKPLPAGLTPNQATYKATFRRVSARGGS